MNSCDPYIHIGQRKIAAREPCYIIAEIGVNHNGDIELAKRMIEAAAAAGANAVKFQTFTAKANILREAPKAIYQERETGSGGQYEMVQQLELPFVAFSDLKQHSESLGVDFITTAFDREALEFVISLKPVCLKWPSGEINNVGLLRVAAQAGLPVLLSTGMASMFEVARAVDILRPRCSFSILQCVSNYPAQIEDQNLRVLPVLSEAFACPVGFSDHTVCKTAAIAARALGMSVLEKHFTLDRCMQGPDHSASMEPKEFAELVATIRTVEDGLGDGIKKAADSEKNTRSVARKSLVYARDLRAGHELNQEDLCAKRPATGIAPDMIDFLIGATLRHDVAADQLIRLGDLQEGIE